MGLNDPYASVAEYKAATNKTGSGDDAVLTMNLQAVSRWIDRKTNRFFTKDDSVQVRYYDGAPGVNQRLLSSLERDSPWPNARTLLHLPDDLASTTGLIVKVDQDRDYTYETTLVISTDFFVGPVNAALGPEPQPYQFLELNPNGTQISTWPAQGRSVQVTALWGWPSVPVAIKTAAILIARQVTDMQAAGATLSVENIDAAVAVKPELANLVYGKDGIVRQYGRLKRTWA